MVPFDVSKWKVMGVLSKDNVTHGFIRYDGYLIQYYKYDGKILNVGYWDDCTFYLINWFREFLGEDGVKALAVNVEKLRV